MSSVCLRVRSCCFLVIYLIVGSFVAVSGLSCGVTQRSWLVLRRSRYPLGYRKMQQTSHHMQPEPSGTTLMGRVVFHFCSSVFYGVSARSFLVIYLIVGSFAVGADLPAVASYLSLKGKASARHLWWAVRSMSFLGRRRRSI